jgi:hypothetical protein
MNFQKQDQNKLSFQERELLGTLKCILPTQNGSNPQQIPILNTGNL